MGLRKPGKIKHQAKRLAEILQAHEKFFSGEPGGVRADLTGADLSRADLSGVNLSDAILKGANLDQGDLRRGKLVRADLSGAKLRKADLRNTDMTEALLPGADLTGAQVSGVELFRCDLRDVIYRGANLRNTNFRESDVRGTKFDGADMGVAILPISSKRRGAVSLRFARCNFPWRQSAEHQFSRVGRTWHKICRRGYGCGDSS